MGYVKNLKEDAHKGKEHGSITTEKHNTDLCEDGQEDTSRRPVSILG